MAGWLWDTNQTGTYGISLAGGVYADNGAIPDQDLVGFIAGPGSLSQTVSGLFTNTPYQLSFAYNAQSAPGANPHLQVTAAGKVLDDEVVTPVGGSNPYRTKTVTFTPTNDTAVISFAQTSATGTLLLDDVRLVGQVPIQTPLAFAPTALLLASTQVAQVQVTVPAAFLVSSPADINISSPNPAVVGILGADPNGVLTLHFAQGVTNVQFFQVVGAGMQFEIGQQLALGLIELLAFRPALELDVRGGRFGIEGQLGRHFDADEAVAAPCRLVNWEEEIGRRRDVFEDQRFVDFSGGLAFLS